MKIEQYHVDLCAYYNKLLFNHFLVIYFYMFVKELNGEVDFTVQKLLKYIQELLMIYSLMLSCNT